MNPLTEADKISALCCPQPRMQWERDKATLAAFQLRMSMEGVDHKNLKRGLKSLPYDVFLSTAYWRTLRVVILVRDGFTCAKKTCGATDELDIHHKSYKHHGEEHLHPEDLETLCGWHHGLASCDEIIRSPK